MYLDKIPPELRVIHFPVFLRLGPRQAPGSVEEIGVYESPSSLFPSIFFEITSQHAPANPFGLDALPPTLTTAPPPLMVIRHHLSFWIPLNYIFPAYLLSEQDIQIVPLSFFLSHPHFHFPSSAFLIQMLFEIVPCLPPREYMLSI